MLEEAGHQDPVIAGNDVFGAIAVVHVEVDDRHPFEPAHIQRMARRHRDVVEETKAHRWSRVAWWPGGRTAQKALTTSPSITASVAATAAPAARNAAPQVPGPALVSGSSARARHWAPAARPALAARARATRVRALELRQRRQRRLAMVQRIGQANGDQVVVDRVQALRALGVAAAHVVDAAIGVAEKGSGHGDRVNSGMVPAHGK